MTRKQEHDFYKKSENQTPQGPARRRKQNLTEMVPVRFEPEVLDEVRKRADADDRSVSAWIRRAVDQALRRTAS
ncbi:MAG: YlcI/YnfO family protein [Actinomycetota bacterium]|nr:YlcI/YnfO family protein [Actinomycetota bacterium]